MSKTVGQTIHISGHKEKFYGVANDATIKPGHLVEVLSTGNIQKQSTAGGRCERAFALENDERGNASPFETAITLTTAYASGWNVPYGIFERGARLVAWFKSGVSYAKGDRLVADGAGQLQKESGLASSGLEKDCIAICDEAIDTTGGAAQGFIRII